LKLRSEISSLDAAYGRLAPMPEEREQGYMLNAFLSYPFTDPAERNALFAAFQQACKNLGHRGVQGSGVDERGEWNPIFTPLIRDRIRRCDVFILYMSPHTIVSPISVENLAASAIPDGFGELDRSQLVRAIAAALAEGPKLREVARTMRPWLLWEAGIAYGNDLPIDTLGHESVCEQMMTSVFQGRHITPVTDADLRRPSNDCQPWGLVSVFEESLRRAEGEWSSRLADKLKS
jgi:hypothetical protein